MARNPFYPLRSGGLLGGGDPFLALHRDVNRLFDDALRGTPASRGRQQGSSGNIVHAHMNVSETEREIRITAELPGVTQDDVEVTLDDDVLTIRGEKRFGQRDEKESFHFVECSYGTFQRALRLPYPIDPEQVQAHFEHGLLTVTLPKTGRQERSRRIQVQSGRGGQTSSIGDESGGASGADQGSRVKQSTLASQGQESEGGSK
jgi:HSP20 family protein